MVSLEVLTSASSLEPIGKEIAPSTLRPTLAEVVLFFSV